MCSRIDKLPFETQSLLQLLLYSVEEVGKKGKWKKKTNPYVLIKRRKKGNWSFKASASCSVANSSVLKGLDDYFILDYSLF